MKKLVRFLPIPSIALMVVGIIAMTVRPTEQGVVFGGLAFTVAVVLFAIGFTSGGGSVRPRTPQHGLQ